MKTAPLALAGDPRPVLSTYMRTKEVTPELIPALAALAGQIGDQVKGYGSLAKVPAEAVGNVRNDMYLSSETIRLMDKGKVGNFDADTQGKLQLFKQQIDDATRFIPLWVKIVVAIALGLGTMVGWKRIVVTVGEKIGKTHLTYAQGASAETVAMLTIGAADMFGLPVSTTHVLSSGVADHGGQWGCVADADHPQFADGVGAHLAGGDSAVRQPLLAVHPTLLTNLRLKM
jgi:PiT family inorganic phosphate transporter